MSSPALALAAANGRYWSTVAPSVDAELARWRTRARAIPDPSRQTAALAKLAQESFNAQAAATLATLAPRPRRREAVAAIVALQAAYDYLDLLCERRLPDQLRDGERLHGAFLAAFDDPPTRPSRDLAGGTGDRGDGYLRELAAAVRGALARLPAGPAVATAARGAARRCATAQVLVNATAHVGAGPAERWARSRTTGGALGWRELLAGASGSVLALHALIAAAADPRTTPRDARRIDDAYLRIAALTMLDGLVDRRGDSAAHALVYSDLYASPREQARRLAAVAHEAAAQTAALPHAAHHAMTLAGVVAYYASAPDAPSDARPVFAALREELGAPLTAALATMRGWRTVKRLRARRIGGITAGGRCYR